MTEKNNNGTINAPEIDEKMIEFEKSSWRNKISFFVFGLANNIIYVLFMTCAVDIMKGSSMPKSIVLLINILPSMIMKFICPFIMHIFPYRLRIWIAVICSIFSLLVSKQLF